MVRAPTAPPCATALARRSGSRLRPAELLLRLLAGFELGGVLLVPSHMLRVPRGLVLLQQSIQCWVEDGTLLSVLIA